MRQERFALPSQPVAGSISCPGGEVALPARGLRHPAARSCPYRAERTLGVSGESVMRQPEAIAVDPSGRVYVADQFSYRVQVFSAGGRFERQWGSYGSKPGQFAAVGGLAVSEQGNVYLLDCANDRVQEFDADGRFIRAWGSPGSALGQLNIGSGTGPAAPPGGGIALSATHVYVADTLNNRIVRYTLTGGEPHVIAAAGRAPGQLHKPRGLAFAPAIARVHGAAGAPEALYVADNGNIRLQELTPQGRFMAQVTSFHARPASFQNPYDVAVHGDHVYVVDDNHGRVVAFDRSLSFQGAFSGSGSMHMTPFIRALAVSPAGEIYVADAHANDVVRFNASGRSIGRFGYSANEPGQFVDPIGVALGPRQSNVVVEAYAGLIHLKGLHPLRQSPVWSTGGEVLLGSLWFHPSAAAIATDGSIWASDLNNAVVRHAAYDGSFIAAAGDPVGSGAPPPGSQLGYAQPNRPGASGGPVHFAHIRRPAGLTILSDGSIVVSDSAERALVKLSPQAMPLLLWPSPAGGGQSFSDPGPLASGPADSLYLLQPRLQLVQHLTAAGRQLASWGQPGDGFGQFRSPSGIAIGHEGHVFVADAALGRIDVFAENGRPLAQFGLPGGAPGHLSDPNGLAIDCRGNLLVADSGNNRLQLFEGVAQAAGCGADG